MLRAEILSTGDEVRTGALVDTNAAWIAESLEQHGLHVGRQTTLGDDLQEIAAYLREIGSRSDLAIVTGGLGPTTDDVTAEAAALASGKKLELDSKALENVRYFFDKLGRPMEECNQKQALLPEKAICLKNEKGSAPGFSMTINNCRFFFLPGVPFEMKYMFNNSVLPLIQEYFGRDFQKVVVKTLATFGLYESYLSERLEGFSDRFPEISLGFRSKFPEIQIKLYARERDGYDREEDLLEAIGYLRTRLGQVIFSENGWSMQEVVGDLLRQNQASLSMAESCTGGLMAHWMTNVAGSSDYFLFSGVTYSNQAKVDILGVSEETLKGYGAVHEQTAREMAEGVKAVNGSDYGLATTGIAGPGGGSPEKPVGTVCIGLSTPDKTMGIGYNFPFDNRLANKKIFAMTALNLLRKHLL